jgi:hypothetical protein
MLSSNIIVDILFKELYTCSFPLYPALLFLLRLLGDFISTGLVVPVSAFLAAPLPGSVTLLLSVCNTRNVDCKA